ncbi:unnamed protein product, partial [Ostreobium quekettii]
GWRGDQAWSRALCMPYFRMFCSEFVAVLEGLATGDEHMQYKCAMLTRYLLAQHMWHTASFLMTESLRAGALLSMGSACLREEDLGPEALKSHFLSRGR